MDKVLVLRVGEKKTVGVEMPFEKGAGLDFYYKNLNCELIDIVDAHGLASYPELSDLCLVCDDEGIFNSGAVNAVASLLYGYMEHGQALFGNVLVCKNHYTEDGTETVGLTDEEMEALQEAIHDMICKCVMK